MSEQPVQHVEVLDENFELSLAEVCHACRVRAETIVALVEEGLLEPIGPSPPHWRFTGPSLCRLEIALRLQRDLRLNVPGASLAVELLEEIERLQERLRLLEEQLLAWE